MVDFDVFPTGQRKDEDEEMREEGESICWRKMLMFMKKMNLMVLMLINQPFVCTAVC